MEMRQHIGKRGRFTTCHATISPSTLKNAVHVEEGGKRHIFLKWILVYNSLKGGCSEVGICSFSHITVVG